MRIVKCPDCNKIFEIESKGTISKNKDGYVKGTKGDFITLLIRKNSETKKSEIQRNCLTKYGDDSLPRINSVLNVLKSKGTIITDGDIIRLL